MLSPTMRPHGGRLKVVAGLSALTAAAVVALFAVSGGGSAAVAGGSTANAPLLDSVLSGVNAHLASVGLSSPPTAVSGTGSTKWLNATHISGQTTADHIAGLWYASLIAGAYDAQCAAAGADCVGGLTFVGTDGPTEDDYMSPIVLQPVTMTSASQSELSSTITKRLAAGGITPSSITFEHPYGPAVVVEIQTSGDPQPIVTNLNEGSIFGDLGLDGYLVRIHDATGNVAYIDAVATRAGVGGLWAAPYLKLPNVP